MRSLILTLSALLIAVLRSEAAAAEPELCERKLAGRQYACIARAVAMIAKVSASGRRVRKGSTDYHSGAWQDVFSCEPAASCEPTFFGCGTADR